MASDKQFNQALDLFIESLYKPDSELRAVAVGEDCLVELLAIRDRCVDHCKTLRRH